MRATATGLFSSTGRIGGIYALVVLGLKRHWSGLPFVLFGAPSVAAALLALFFPGMVRTTFLSVTNVKFGPATRQAHNKNYKDIRQVHLHLSMNFKSCLFCYGLKLTYSGLS